MNTTGPISLTVVLAGAMACTSQRVPSAQDEARDVEALNAVLAEHVMAVNSGDGLSQRASQPSAARSSAVQPAHP